MENGAKLRFFTMEGDHKCQQGNSLFSSHNFKGNQQKIVLISRTLRSEWYHGGIYDKNNFRVNVKSQIRWKKNIDELFMMNLVHWYLFFKVLEYKILWSYWIKKSKSFAYRKTNMQ